MFDYAEDSHQPILSLGDDTLLELAVSLLPPREAVPYDARDALDGLRRFDGSAAEFHHNHRFAAAPCSSPLVTITSAICTAFSAAPFNN